MPALSATYTVPVNESRTNAPARLILLGASNLTRGLGTVVDTARSMLGPPVEIFACLGHGRSYGQASTVLGRTLPGILQSGIWDALDVPSRAGSVQTFALITDIGNDIMYGAAPETIAQWVEECVNRLEGRGATVAVTALPIESIRTVRSWQYAIVRSLLFPTRRITFEQAMKRAHDLHERMTSLAGRRNLALIDCERDWYGFDPIHIRIPHWSSAWARILGSSLACADHANHRARLSFRRWLHMHTLTPHQLSLLGLQRRRRQPCAHLDDGTTISLF
jgi:hypothetical protein